MVCNERSQSEKTLMSNISRAVVVCGVVSGLAAFVTSIFAPTNPIQNTTVSLMASAASTVTVISKARYGIAAFHETDQGEAKELRDMSATIDCVMALLGMFRSCYHFYELSNEPASSGRSEAILDETASICSAFGRIAQDGAWLDDDPETKEVLAATAAILMLVYSALEFSSGAIETAYVRPGFRTDLTARNLRRRHDSEIDLFCMGKPGPVERLGG